MRNHIILQNNVPKFNLELDDVLNKFPSLKIVSENNETFLKGILDVLNDEGKIIKSFFIEIHNSKNFPFEFPTLFEIGGEIPNEEDWHKYKNGSCCITVPQEEKIICKNGISIIKFIENHAVPFLTNYIHRKEHGYYKNGDYEHGYRGFKQFYSCLFRSDVLSEWKRDLDFAFGKNKITINRNDKCFCNSGLKYKKCHHKIFQELQFLGENSVKNDIINIIKKA